MAARLFISYSRADGRELSLRLHAALGATSPAFAPWIDLCELKAGRDWDDQIADAIRDCDALLFVMSPDSVAPGSGCKSEWTRALKYKKPVIPLLLDRDAEIPFGLDRREHSDFTGAFEPAIDDLCRHLRWLFSPAGMLQQMKDRLAESNRDRRRARDAAMSARIQDEVTLLEKQIADQQLIIDDARGVAARVERSIAHEMEEERRPTLSPTSAPSRRFINPPPALPPTYFQDRAAETLQVGTFLKEDSIRLVWLVGRGGTGKTALICRLLKSLERGTLPDDGGPLHLDGIAYLSTIGSRGITVHHLFADICKLLPEDAAGELMSLYRNPKVGIDAKMVELLKACSSLRAVVLLDNFEGQINSDTRTVASADLAEALRVVLTAPHHTIKVVVTTQVAPLDLTQIQPGRQRRLDLDEGLASPHAENILRLLDFDGRLGLKGASDALLDEARQRTRGIPKALESLFGILMADRDTSLPEILEVTRPLLPERVFEVMVGEASSRLDPVEQQVMQVMAIYGRPVPPVAVDFLLQTYRPGLESAPILSRLVNLKLLQKESGRYYLHPVDREYALGRIVPGSESDRGIAHDPPFTQFALFHRAADYFNRTQKPKADWKTIDDLAAPLAEFDFRCHGHDYEAAAQLLDTIDSEYLQLWGHLGLVVELRERLVGKVTDRRLSQINTGNLGRAYLQVGRVGAARACFDEALQGARERDDRQGMSVWLGYLAFSSADLGRTQEAMTLCEDALAIAREIDDRRQEGSLLGFLGHCYLSEGKPGQAIPLTEQGLELARATGDVRGEGADLSGLAGCYFTLGETAKAIEYAQMSLSINKKCGDIMWTGNGLSHVAICYHELGQSDVAVEYMERALAIARQTGHRFGESLRLIHLALIHLNEGRCGEALTCGLEATRIAKTVERPKLMSLGRFALSQVYFHSEDLAAARAEAEFACKSDFVENSHNAFALLGLIALKQGEQDAARTAFEGAIAAADIMLTRNERCVDALDAKGLACCGLMLSGDPGKVPLALEAYRAARAINRDVGVVKRALRLFDALPAAEDPGALAGVRLAAATGTRPRIRKQGR